MPAEFFIGALYLLLASPREIEVGELAVSSAGFLVVGPGGGAGRFEIR
jgi:hypothetical protein